MPSQNGFEPQITGEYAVTTHGLTKRYGNRDIVVDLNLMVPKGSVFGFLGPNGAGKTTTMRMMAGLIRPSSGQISIFGQDLAHNRAVLSRYVSTMIETPGFYPFLSGQENLCVLARTSEHKPTTAQLDEVFDLVGLKGREHDRVRTYSTGMKQRLGLAIALVTNSRLLILDEPTNGLDPAGTLEIRNLVRQLNRDGRTIMISSHLMHEVEQICTHVGIIAGGRLQAQGPMSMLLAHHGGIRIEVSDPMRAAEVIGTQLQFSVQVQDSQWIVVQADKPQVPALLSVLDRAAIDVFQTHVSSGSLEQFFIEITS